MREVANALYSSTAVLFNAKYINGFNAPIYIDIRRTLSAVDERSIIIQALIDTIAKCYIDCECVAGVSTAGIPYAAMLAHNLHLPMCYVRQVPKDHGLGNIIEGKTLKDQKVVVIEDVLGSGNNALNVVSTLQKAEVHVWGIVSIFSYELEMCIQRISNSKLEYQSLTYYEEVVDLGVKKGIISKADYSKLLYYKENMPDLAWKS